MHAHNLFSSRIKVGQIRFGKLHFLFLQSISCASRKLGFSDQFEMKTPEEQDNTFVSDTSFTS